MDSAAIQKMKTLSAKAAECGKILPVSEAFKMHPVDEEVHKGKIEYWTKETPKREMRN